MSHDSRQDAPQAGAGLLASIPAMPAVPRDDLYRGSPYVLASGRRHSLGWRDDRKAGPSFVVVRMSRLGMIRVTQRFPLTEQGWARAWRALSGLDAGATAAVAARLAKQEAGRRAAAALAALDAESVYCMRLVTYNGGSGGVALAKGQAYDLRFLDDRVMVGLPRSAEAIVEVPYRDVETVEVSGSSPSKSTGDLLAVILALGLVGAVLGLLVLGLLGLLLGAVIFGLVGALLVASPAKTVVRLVGGGAEYYFLTADKRPDTLRIELSEPLTAIGNARAARENGSDQRPDLASESILDKLGKLVSLLQQGLITRDEFEHLKAKLMAE